MRKGIRRTFLFSLLITSAAVSAQQIPDTSFLFPIRQAAYEPGRGPVVFIDQAHNNFHTRGGGFSPFSKLLEQDGYRVTSLDQTLSGIGILDDCRILVIANALNRANARDWVLPTPSAFSKDEIGIIAGWVKNGGSLFLIADHMPFAGAAAELGKAFGFEFLNGFAFTRERGSWPPSTFSAKDGTLQESPVTVGLKEYKKIDSVSTFTGSSFKAPEEAIPVLSFPGESFSLEPDTAWSFSSKTPKINLGGYCQGAIREYGKGKIAVFGEAAMFTAQLANGTVKFGFNSELAPQNAQFTLNLIHWLDGAVPVKPKAVNETGEKIKRQ